MFIERTGRDLDSGVVKDHGRFAMDRSPVCVHQNADKKDDVIALRCGAGDPSLPPGSLSPTER
jgi:hypothetical protein